MLKNKRVSKSCAEGSSEAYLLWWAMADSIENAGRATVSGSKETMEVSKNFKDFAGMWRGKYCAVQRSKRAIK